MPYLVRAIAVCLASLLPASVLAGPRVVADIAPVHALVAQVMDGAGRPVLLLPPGASPHHYALKPSQASALARADLVLWIGEALTPWLADVLTTLAPDADRLALMDVPETTRLPFRSLDGDGAGAGTSGHTAGADEHDDDDENDDAHADEHRHGDIDPHVWLDPSNAQAWLGVIADRLAMHDPENAALYRANAARAQAELDRLAAEVAARLAPVQGVPFLAAHDSLQYFERRFGLQAAASIAASDDRRPGPRRVAALAQLVEAREIGCILTEPGADASLARRLAERTQAQIGSVDIIGAAKAPGPMLYGRLMRKLADDLAACLRAAG